MDDRNPALAAVLALALLSAASPRSLGAEPAAVGEEAPLEVGQLALWPHFESMLYVAFTARGEEERGPGARASTTTTVAGESDLLLVGALSPSLSALAQLGASAVEGGEGEARLEQLQIKLARSDRLALRAGKFHTPIGLWNQTDHAVAWLRPSADRPEMYRLREDGGLLPLRAVGVELSGNQSYRPLDLSWGIGAVKARGATVLDAVELDDLADVEGVTLRLAVDLTRLRYGGLQIGLSGHLETLKPDLGGELDERIAGIFVALDLLNLDLVAELLEVRHSAVAGGPDFASELFYLQVGTGFFRGRLYLYERTEALDLDADDPYLAPLELSSQRKATTGLRVAPTPWLAFKLEYAYTDRKGGVDSHGLALQTVLSTP